MTSCLVNPRACHETELVIEPATEKKSIAVVGAGPAGLAFATTAASRGHSVTLFDSADEIGGQFNLAKQIPGKEEFYETLRYFQRQIELTGVKLELGKTIGVGDLADSSFDEVVLATGITPRTPAIDGIDHPKVLSYLDVLKNKVPVGKKVAIVTNNLNDIELIRENYDKKLVFILLSEFTNYELMAKTSFKGPKAFFRFKI